MDYWMIIAVLCAYVVKGLCAFANTLVFSTILSFRTSNLNITPIELIVGYPANAIIAWKEKKSLQWKIWIPLSVLVIAGSIPGALLLKNADNRIIKIFFGIAVAAIGVEMFFRESRQVKKKSSPFVLWIIGAVSGLLCGLFGIGALLAAYVGRTADNNQSFRGNLCMVFLVENTFRILLYLAAGIITPGIMKTSVFLLPFMLIGLGIGNYLARILDERKVKKVVILSLIISGVWLVLKNISWL
ncbi:sulfite exporter TauE/SafE family protein [Anaerocolumna sp. AGMB13020]|uniref:sulfite exporter TauE/SafE family protein n=1 Tax=Anaerocolumna sp. AGMB13020 TaxID=3081750 RepID=UPI00295488AD|nr:sulfite exporter TauE/SafE family protein [Anaerocolumna sp. AGMB13020]WOO35062.1 sulfite exporter TauE/SafE family protein [Anaerocolumna sp. AGMB13020]